MNEHKYPLEVFWDEGSEAFVCIVPDLPGCSAIGDTPQDAVKEMETAMR
jgi:predicted RNase H-like HicB family nuclease